MNNLNSAETIDYQPFSLQSWREDFIRIILIGASIFAFISLTVNFLGQKPPVYLAVYTALFIILLLVTFIRFQYQLKAGTFLGLICALGISSLIETGIWGGSRMYFLTLVLMSGLLYSPRASVNAIVISTVLITIAGLLVLTGKFQPTDQNVPPGTISVWGINSSALIMVQVVVATGLNLFQKQFMKAQEQASRAVGTLGTKRADLETRVAERTRALEERNSQMRSIVYFARQLAEIQDISTLLNETVKLITQQFGYYHAAIFLLDEQMKTAFLQAASSEAGRIMLEQGYRVERGDRSVIGRVAEQGKLHITTGAIDSTRSLQMPRTRSQIALPLLVRGKVIGVLDIQSEQAQAFGQNEADVFQLLADQIAASITDTRLLSESQAFMNQLEAITSQQTRGSWREHLKTQRSAYQFTPAGIKSVASGTLPKDKNELSIPLVLRGQEIGVIGLKRKGQTRWADADRELAEKIATQVALALENSRLLEETRRRALQEQTVNEISARFNRSLDIDTLLQTAARELGALPDVAEASVYIGGQDNKRNESKGT
ncbi:MAG: GAF domain-containing protein [Chloroflexi bacterium]|nr:GAF domain-containing protein [Chloroflexota bacterium]